ncbi:MULTISPECIES: 6,7-dimethyl-8-ribityllumazine synthase [unclassified Methylophilus]|uniref:6,7-dimethyl-8-ribityllumazine synthase n=1 Tax=unclassified Methylophilus TaxID=2630143 RepID=UPI0006FA249E|nr:MULTISPECIES: 6,7-dimethyl-8-ribityllumazine synthase [unclassified Methylophilus]KQT42274.1 6,7-dimethyl-8-ribityllumazine synthase [Methylophilus sp. Leaf416]KQT56456.1 6,7-dimethyl-8-ribityllumazine synthase [Methylophilus sp. Leaf459]
MNKISPNLDGTGKKIGIVLSRFNENIGAGLLHACEQELLKLGVKAEDITLATVPGALESPLVLQHMALTETYDALIALGAIIRGETYHFEVVSNESARGISEVQRDTGVPVANAILTTENDEQAEERVAVKGAEAAQVAIEMANLVNAL